MSAAPYHPADLGTDRFETSVSLLENESVALREIDLALSESFALLVLLWFG